MKTCKAPSCISPAQSHGYCFRHGYMRTDTSYIKAQEKKQQASNRLWNTGRREKKDYGFGFDNQLDMFGRLWENAKDRNGIITCPYTGEKLNRFLDTDLWLNCFAHVLPKKNYTYFKLNPDNIRIVFPDFHRICDCGSSNDRKKHEGWKFDEWDALVIELKQKYAEFKKENLLA